MSTETAHHFETSWQPHPDPERRRDVAHDQYEAHCPRCDLTIVNPSDAHVIDHCPPVEALTPEWLGLMGYPDGCSWIPDHGRFTIFLPHPGEREEIEATWFENEKLRSTPLTAEDLAAIREAGWEYRVLTLTPSGRRWHVYPVARSAFSKGLP